MKISELKKLAWVFFALALTTTTLSAQGWGNGNSSFNSPNNNCINQVTGLSEDQKAKIEGLNKSHLEKMAQLRSQRQSTTDAIEKSEIRTTMLKNVKAHRDEVNSLLTTEQQKEFAALQQRGNYGNGRVQGNFQSCGQGKRNCQFAGNYGNRSNRNSSGSGYGNGTRRNQNCYRN